MRGETVYARVALVLSIIAVTMGGWALITALHRPPDLFPLFCGQTFRSSTGQVSPVYYPCASQRPTP